MACIEQQGRDLVANVTAGGPRMMRDDAVRLVAAAMRAAPEATQSAGWQKWDAVSEAWESATEQRYSVMKRVRPEQARDVFTPAPVRSPWPPSSGRATCIMLRKEVCTSAPWRHPPDQRSETVDADRREVSRGHQRSDRLPQDGRWNVP